MLWKSPQSRHKPYKSLLPVLDERWTMAFKAAPLPHEWMIASIIGFFVALLQIYPYVSKKWGTAFMLFFILLFISSMVSMSSATTDDEHLDVLAAHYKRR
jgi:hypothetical protein